ncbi:MAG: hypothetical protein PHW63_08905 [Alphaproteobacteria bacterium]|nr:hypothetical protein [Alphaproteobacteria bacterium]
MSAMMDGKTVSCPVPSFFEKAASAVCGIIGCAVSICADLPGICTVGVAFGLAVSLPLSSVLSGLHSHIHPTHKKELVIIASSITETSGRKDEDKGYKFLYPEAHVISGEKLDSVTKVVDELCQEVQKRGTLDTVILSSHGGSNGVELKKGDWTKINGLMFAIAAAQARMGTKLSKEYMFDTCNTFTNLTTKDTEFYSNTSKFLDADIVGGINSFTRVNIVYPSLTYNKTPAFTMGKFPVMFRDVRYCRFSPDGSITEDPRSSTPLVRRISPNPDDKDSSWFDRAVAVQAKERIAGKQASTPKNPPICNSSGVLLPRNG